MSHKPGMRTLPRPSMTRAPWGTAVVAAGPSATMRLPRTTTLRSRRGSALRPSMTLTLVNAVTDVCASRFAAHSRTPMHGRIRENMGWRRADGGTRINCTTDRIGKQLSEIRHPPSAIQFLHAACQVLFGRGDETSHLIHGVVQVRRDTETRPVLAGPHRCHHALVRA